MCYNGIYFLTKTYKIDKQVTARWSNVFNIMTNTGLKITYKICSTLPIVNFHMLSIEEKHSCWNQRDIKVTCVDWHCVDIHNVYISHARNIMRRFGQLFCQGKITHYKIIHIINKSVKKSI